MFYTPQRGHRFVDRGERDDYNFYTGYWVKDGAWHDLDLAIAVPIGAKLVFIKFKVNCAVSPTFIKLRTKGVTNVFSESVFNILVADTEMYGYLWIVPDSNRIIQYNVPAVAFTDLFGVVLS
ncbi:unnamed protein product, partial [marine sediment metagenome]